MISPEEASRPMDMDWRQVDTTYCGIAATTSVVGDRWSQLILREIFFDVRRFHDILEHTGVSTAVLTDRLKKLCDDGILTKVRYQDDGRRHRYEYELTERGVGLIFVNLALAEFGYDHLIADRHRLVGLFDRDSGQRVRLGLVREDGTVIGLEALEARIVGPETDTP